MFHSVEHPLAKGLSFISAPSNLRDPNTEEKHLVEEQRQSWILATRSQLHTVIQRFHHVAQVTPDIPIMIREVEEVLPGIARRILVRIVSETVDDHGLLVSKHREAHVRPLTLFRECAIIVCLLKGKQKDIDAPLPG